MCVLGFDGAAVAVAVAVAVLSFLCRFLSASRVCFCSCCFNASFEFIVRHTVSFGDGLSCLLGAGGRGFSEEAFWVFVFWIVYKAGT